MMMGLYGFASFFLVISLLVERTDTATAFICASIVAMAVQGLTLKLMRRWTT